MKENWMNLLQRIRLETAIDNLSNTQQQIIRAYYFEGDMTLQTVAEKLGISKASAKKEHQRALEKLRSMLK